MSLSVCSGCRRHVRDGEGCPFCGGRPRTAVDLWRAAVLTAMMPLGLAACQSGSVSGGGEASKPAVTETKPEGSGAKPDSPDPAAGVEPIEADSATPDPGGQERPDPGRAEGGENSKPDGTDTPIVEEVRPPTKYGAPPRPKPKYGGPPRPKPEPVPRPEPDPGG